MNHARKRREANVSITTDNESRCLQLVLSRKEKDQGTGLAGIRCRNVEVEYCPDVRSGDLTIV
jgi:hypothetical protein